MWGVLPIAQIKEECHTGNRRSPSHESRSGMTASISVDLRAVEDIKAGLTAVDLSGAVRVPSLGSMNVAGGLQAVSLGNGLYRGFSSLNTVVKESAEMVEQIADVFMEIDAQLAALATS